MDAKVKEALDELKAYMTYDRHPLGWPITVLMEAVQAQDKEITHLKEMNKMYKDMLKIAWEE